MCGILGILDESGSVMPSGAVIAALETMRPRFNGLGGGFAGYGIYPKYRDCHALHLILDDEEARRAVDEYLQTRVTIVKDEAIPTRKVRAMEEAPLLWRYFIDVPEASSEDFMLDLVMAINTKIEGAHVMSSGKNTGIFKAVGYPRDVADFYRLDDYSAYMWLAHGRYPTNSPAWWAGAHPLGILGWSVIHNGEISSYGTNIRYLEQWGYRCVLHTDSEVLPYMLDLLIRRHRLPADLACKIMAVPFWQQIDALPPEERKALRAVRVTYASALINGPSSIVAATNKPTGMMIGLTDRIKLRPLVFARKGNVVYMASEECAIRRICPDPDKVTPLKAGVPVIVRVRDGHLEQNAIATGVPSPDR